MGSGHAKNEKDCGMTSSELVGGDKYSGFLWPSQWGQKRPKEAHRYSDQVRSNIHPRVKSWNYFSACSTTWPLKKEK